VTLPTRTPPDQLHRIGRDDDAWAWPDWLFAGDDGTFGNRWDDPIKKYRVLYACSQRLGAFVEMTCAPDSGPHAASASIPLIDRIWSSRNWATRSAGPGPMIADRVV